MPINFRHEKFDEWWEVYLSILRQALTDTPMDIQERLPLDEKLSKEQIQVLKQEFEYALAASGLILMASLNFDEETRELIVASYFLRLQVDPACGVEDTEQHREELSSGVNRYLNIRKEQEAQEDFIEASCEKILNQLKKVGDNHPCTYIYPLPQLIQAPFVALAKVLVDINGKYFPKQI